MCTFTMTLYKESLANKGFDIPSFQRNSEGKKIQYIVDCHARKELLTLTNEYKIGSYVLMAIIGCLKQP